MKRVLIVNPISGKVNAGTTVLPKLEAAARAADLTYEVVYTEYAGHARDLAIQYAQTGEPVRLYACGGDGTLSEVFSGAYLYPNAEVGSIPCGSGNDFVRNFGTAEDFLDFAGQLAGTAISIDLVQTSSGISAAICSAGLDADVAYSIPQFRHIPMCGGSMAYNLSILKALLGKLGKRMRLELDGLVYEDEYTIVAICNGVAYGGGFRAAPTANLQDGLLEVVSVKKLSRLRIAGVLAQYKAGKHVDANEMVAENLRDILNYRKARHVKLTACNGKEMIVNIDGECTSAVQLEARVLPGAARFILPKALYEAFQNRS